MTWVMDFLILFCIVLCAVASIRTKDLLVASLILAGYSLLMAFMWTLMNAVDVAFTEAVVGAGVTTVLFITAISRTTREEE